MYANNINTVLDRMLTFGRAVEEAAGEPLPTSLVPRTQLWLPTVDIYETESAFVVEADLPGIHRENVDIQFDRNTLTISGTRAATLPSQKNSQLRVFSAERVSGGFSRSIRLPEHVDAEKIDASYADGVLRVTVPKSAGARPRKIAIGAKETSQVIAS